MVYLLLNFISLNLFSWWWFWIMLEILNWFLITFMNKKIIMLNFLLWQSLSSLMILFNLVANLDYFFINIFIFMKTSLPPFHYLFWKFHIFVSWKVFMIFMTLHKFLPLMFMVMFFMKIFYITIIIFPVITFFMMWNNMNLFSNLYLFMMGDSCWMIMSFFVSLKMSIFYMLMNLFMFFMMMMIKPINKENFKNSVMMKFILLLLFSLPPFFTFLLKFLLISSISTHVVLLFLFLYLISIFFYWEIFYFTIINLLLMSFKSNMLYILIICHMMFLWIL
uniref:NADH dehydrogenase subunit 2 n=1 Tax=Romanomermis nielseni TaxID=416167 RepID=A1Z397_9BILA|nr:NADH dehydrogenase subunit 2 [Romanomermis nielseni]ABL73780.1 NADH dehydrogenase subunit 2 [Romanomermis nielseni]